MTTYFQFAPNVQAPYTFQPTLDGQGYTASVTWNLYGQRWYLNINQLTGPLIVARALLGSPDGTRIQSLTWASGAITAVTSEPHEYTTGQTIDITITGCAPDAYNGIVQALIVDAFSFKYSLASDPGDVTQLGAQIYNINLVAGYFSESTMVFRASNQVFEVTP